MGHEQEQNRNEWTFLDQKNYFQSPQQQMYYPEGNPQGYAPVQDYTSGSQGDYSEYSDSTRTSDGSSRNSNTVDKEETSEHKVQEFVSTRRQKGRSKAATRPKKQQPKSKRAQLREKIAKENHGEVASGTDAAKGLVEWQEGIFRWWDPEEKIWLEAAYHDEYRQQFIEEDAAEGAYDVAPECGKGALDITSFCGAYNQGQWRIADRESWNNIVDGEGNKVLYLLERPVEQSYDEPERLWEHDGCVLLDGDNNPVRPWAGIPRAFSSNIEGGRIEALRRILPMTTQDFRARMLRFVPTAAGHGASTKPLSLPSTFGHRSSRFRALYQVPAWNPRAASDVLKKQVLDALPEAGEAAATTTEGLQKLTKYELDLRKTETRGRFLYKANGRAISDQERRKRDRKVDARLKRQAAKQPQTTQRPQNMPGTPALRTASTSPYLPTAPAYTNSYLPTPPFSAGDKRRRDEEDDRSGYLDADYHSAKRARHATTSPLYPRIQGPFLYPQQLNPGSPSSQRALKTYAPSKSTVGVPHPQQHRVPMFKTAYPRRTSGEKTNPIIPSPTIPYKTSPAPPPPPPHYPTAQPTISNPSYRPQHQHQQLYIKSGAHFYPLPSHHTTQLVTAFPQYQNQPVLAQGGLPMPVMEKEEEDGVVWQQQQQQQQVKSEVGSRGGGRVAEKEKEEGGEWEDGFFAQFLVGSEGEEDAEGDVVVDE